MIFKTQNSTYEINEDEHLIRRLGGVNEPTSYQGTDWEWKKYESIQELSFGLMIGLMIVWGTDVEGVVQTTLTSPVVHRE